MAIKVTQRIGHALRNFGPTQMAAAAPPASRYASICVENNTRCRASTSGASLPSRSRASARIAARSRRHSEITDCGSESASRKQTAYVALA